MTLPFQLLKVPRYRVALLLFMVWGASLTQYHDARHLFYPLMVVGIGTSLDAVVHRLRGQRVFPSSALITSLLVALIIAPEAGLAPMIIAVVLAQVSKYVLRSPRHWFNPAALGIVGSAWLYQVPVSWWAVSWSWIPAALIIVWMVVVLRQLRRLWLPATFMAVYLIWLAGTMAAGFNVLRVLLDGTTALFVFVMLTEPMTSPAVRSWKYLFGVLVGVLVIAVSRLSPSAPLQIDVLLVSLLLANAVAAVARRKVPA